nr:uncharacterized protein LOC102539576 isoform X2 [Vicugna pacos]XP_031526931.1 uncharacterized protein LOC102539576 isoform X2 [Vicugna pacos]XP_031526932.1 uncharacterized protein LOC102539576 isoform X2 [Vicugna pacos]XP_031526934.1 uncharacterized protein LOC102539576 isoform X2 [Vicugna pacos]
MSTPPTQGFSLRRDVYTDIPSLLNTLLKVEEWALVLPQRPDTHQMCDAGPSGDPPARPLLRDGALGHGRRRVWAARAPAHCPGVSAAPRAAPGSRGRSSLKIKWKRPSAKSPPEEVEPWDCLCLRAVQTGAGVRRAREACGAAPQLTWVTVMVTQSLGCSEAPAGPSRRRRAGEVRITQTTLACLSGDSEVEPGHGHQRNSVLKSHNIETFYCALASPKGLAPRT